MLYCSQTFCSLITEVSHSKDFHACHRLQAKQSHMPHCRVTLHLLNFSTGHTRGHKHSLSLQSQWPGKWNRGEGWYESDFPFEKPKVKLSDLDLWKWRRVGWMGGERGRLAREQKCILMSWKQEHNSMTDCDGKKMGQAGNNGWCHPGLLLQQPARIRNHCHQWYRHLNEPYTSVLGDWI